MPQTYQRIRYFVKPTIKLYEINAIIRTVTYAVRQNFISRFHDNFYFMNYFDLFLYVLRQY